jgi:hypothetical protein
MRNFLTKLWHDKRGNSLMIAAAALPLLIGSAGLATDTIQWALWKRQLQRAADSAAIAGVYDRVANASATTNTSTAVSHDLTLDNELYTKIPQSTGYPKITFPANSGSNQNQVKVELAIQRPLSFSSMFMSHPPLIKTAAIAASVGATGDFCVLSLQNNSKTGIQATGSAGITMDCGMMTNSTSINAAAGQGSSIITATNLAAAGAIQQSSNWRVTSYQPYSPALADPYANLSPSTADGDFDKCSASPPALTVNNTNDALVVTGGACYSSISINSNRTLTLKDGIYVVNGGNLDIQGTLNLTNATILLTNKSSGNQPIGSINMNSSGKMNATAPITGKWAGMAIYQDRRATDSSPTGNISSSSPNKINGSSGYTIRGVIYFPNQQVTYDGNGTGGAVCTQFVIKRIYWSGNSGVNNFTKNCGMYGIGGITSGQRVRLVA